MSFFWTIPTRNGKHKISFDYYFFYYFEEFYYSVVVWKEIISPTPILSVFHSYFSCCLCFILRLIHLLISRTLYNWCRWSCECLFNVTWWPVTGRLDMSLVHLFFMWENKKQIKTNRFDVFVGLKMKLMYEVFIGTRLCRSENAHLYSNEEEEKKKIFSKRLGWHSCQPNLKDVTIVISALFFLAAAATAAAVSFVIITLANMAT